MHWTQTPEGREKMRHRMLGRTGLNAQLIRAMQRDRASGMKLKEGTEKYKVSESSWWKYSKPGAAIPANMPVRASSNGRHDRASIQIPDGFVTFALDRLEQDIHEWIEQLKAQLGPGPQSEERKGGKFYVAR